MSTLTVDKNKIDALIAAKKFVGLNRSPRAEKIIVSLTSYKPRIDDVKYAIYSLLNQTFPPDELILWLDEGSFPRREKNLPQDLLELKNFGLTIDWCENLRSYKKLIPVLEKFPDDIIVTADDDLFYQPDWLEILCAEHLKNPACVVAHYVHKIRLDKCGKIFPFRQWCLGVNPAISLPPAFSYVAGTGGGVLFKKNFLHDDALKREKFLALSPVSDEIWFWAMAVLNGTKIKIPSAAQSQLIFVDVDRERHGETLWKENLTGGKQDIQLRQIIENYPGVLDALIREAADSQPSLSVVLLLENVDDLESCLNNFFAQKFPDFELIVVNVGARVDVPNLPTNFKIVNYLGGSSDDALNLGLKKSSGRYILFKDAETFLASNGLEVIAQALDASKAEVIHFAGHFQVDGKKFFDDEILFNAPIFFDEPKSKRALLWFEGKLNGRLDTKIFKRKFLAAHEINFDKGLEEFLFGALIQSEKYFLVPQGFCFLKE